MQSDNQLIAAFLTSRDEQAFTRLVSRYQNGIRQFLRRLTAGDYALADDVAQETFIAMYKSLESFRAESKLSTWLHQIAYRCFLRQQQNLNKVQWVDDEHLVNFAAVEKDLVTDIALERLMATLSVDERLALTLAYSAGMSHSEIESVTGMPLGTIKSHIQRGRKKLSDRLAENTSNPKEAVA